MPAPLQQSWPRLGAEARGRIRVADPRRSSWLVLHRPLRKIWVRHLGWWHSQYMKKCSKSPTKQVFFSVLLFVNMEFGRTRMQERHKSGWKPSCLFLVCYDFLFFSVFPAHKSTPKEEMLHIKKSWRHHRSTAGWCFGWTYFEIQVA